MSGLVAEPETQKRKQTVYRDGNCIPRGVVNTISLAPATPETERQPQPRKMNVMIVTQKDNEPLCDLHKEGSLERRNCCQYIGFEHRIE